MSFVNSFAWNKKLKIMRNFQSIRKVCIGEIKLEFILLCSIELLLSLILPNLLSIRFYKFFPV